MLLSSFVCASVNRLRLGCRGQCGRRRRRGGGRRRLPVHPLLRGHRQPLVAAEVALHRLERRKEVKEPRALVLLLCHLGSSNWVRVRDQ